jgi:hypothetical protein
MSQSNIVLLLLLLLLNFLAPVTAQIPSLESLASIWQGRNETIGNMPTQSNFFGSATPSTDPLDALGLDVYDSFPFVGWLRTRLSALDTNNIQQFFAPNSSRWLASRSERRAYAPGQDFSTITAEISHRFLFESSSTLIMVSLRNDGSSPISLKNLQLSMTSGVRLVTEMSWVVPLPGDDGSWACTGYYNSINYTSMYFMDSISRAKAVIGTVPPPITSTGGGQAPSCWGNLFYGDVLLAPNGGFWNLTLVLVPGLDMKNLTIELNSLLANPVVAAVTSDLNWETRWQQAFTPNNNHYSGNAPLLSVTNDDPLAVSMSNFYYMSVLTVLTTERVNWPQSALYSDCPRLYAIGQEGLAGGGAPAGRPLGGSAFWIWDESYASLILSLLDPNAVRAYLRALLQNVNISTTNAIDLISGEPILPWPDGFGGGGFYAFNAQQLFTMVSNYITTTNDTAFLNENIGPLSKRVADTLLSLALHWQNFDLDNNLLVEYSDDDGNYLECVPHYRGAVAALQAGSVFMMRSVADLIDRLYSSDPILAPWPVQLRTLATNMSNITRTLMYVSGQGQWSTFVSSANPQFTPVPTVVDFAHVSRFLRNDLSNNQTSESSEFFLSQLLFPNWTGWLRALAVPDGDYSQRADHGTTGSYTTWGSLSIEALAINDGNWSRAITLFDQFAPILRLGPLGQAGQVKIIGIDNSTEHVVFKAPEWPFVNIAGANFADVILRSLFGFDPKWASSSLADVELFPPLVLPLDFNATLENVRTPLGKLATAKCEQGVVKWSLS